MDKIYTQALEMMGLAFNVLFRKVGAPQLQPMGDGDVYRYKEKRNGVKSRREMGSSLCLTLGGKREK